MRLASAWLIAAAGLLASAAQCATLNATPATLNAVARAAKEGDVIVMPGATGAVLLNNVAAPELAFPGQGVTIDLTGSNLTFFYAAKVANLTVRGGSFTATDWHGCVQIVDFRHVAILGVECHNGGLILNRGDGGRIEDSSSDGPPGTGAYIGGVTHFDVGNITISASRGDGVDVDGSGFGRIHDIRCINNVLTPTHPDCVQLFPAMKPYQTISHDIEIDHNIASGDMQGFSAFQGAAGLYTHDNEVISSMPQGIGQYDCTHCVIANNHLTTMANARWQTTINTPRLKGVRCGNRVEAYGRSQRVTDGSCPASASAADMMQRY